MSAFRGKDYAIPPLATFICACFAKTSVVWIPMCYALTSTHFELQYVKKNAFDQPVGTIQIDTPLLDVPLSSPKNGDMKLLTVTENIPDT